MAAAIPPGNIDDCTQAFAIFGFDAIPVDIRAMAH